MINKKNRIELFLVLHLTSDRLESMESRKDLCIFVVLLYLSQQIFPLYPITLLINFYE